MRWIEKRVPRHPNNFDIAVVRKQDSSETYDFHVFTSVISPLLMKLFPYYLRIVILQLNRRLF